MPRLAGPSDIAFLDGYMFRVLFDLLRAEGKDESGLYDYYSVRIENNKNALSNYDRVLVEYISEKFGHERPIIHAGTGLGTLPAALALAGYRVAGIEHDAKRYRAAGMLRNALIEAWPEVADLYELIEGSFPDVLAGGSWAGADTVLVFTNCGAGWDDTLTTRIIEFAAHQGATLFDARLFGVTREEEADRDALLARFAAAGLARQPIPGMPSGVHYHHLQRSFGA